MDSVCSRFTRLLTVPSDHKILTGTGCRGRHIPRRPLRSELRSLRGILPPEARAVRLFRPTSAWQTQHVRRCPASLTFLRSRAHSSDTADIIRIRGSSHSFGTASALFPRRCQRARSKFYSPQSPRLPSTSRTGLCSRSKPDL